MSTTRTDITVAEGWEIVLENDGLVKKAVDEFCRRHSGRSFEDWLSEGYVGAHYAVMTFDPTKGTKLSTWMYRLMIQHLITAWKQEERQTHELSYEPGHGRVTGSRQVSFPVSMEHSAEDDERHGASGLPLGGNTHLSTLTQEESFEGELVDSLANEQDFRRVSEIILSSCTEQEMAVLHKRYFGGMTLEEIAQEFGLSRERIRQVQEKALAKVRRAVNQDAWPSPDGGESSATSTVSATPRAQRVGQEVKSA